MNDSESILLQKCIRTVLDEARKAYESNEVPVAAVVFDNEKIISKAHNQMQLARDPTQHAEMIALRKAIQQLKIPRLNGYQMLVTLEPCAMCAGAIVLARIDKLYIMAKDEKAGACGSVLSIIPNLKLNHRPTAIWLDENPDYISLLHQFFNNLRH